MMKKRALATLAIMLLALLAVALLRYVSKPDISPENTALVRRGNLSAEVSALGQVAPRRSVNLSLRVSGTVADLNVQEGDIVAEHQVLLALEDQEYVDAVAQAQRSVDLAQDQLVQAKQAPSSAEIKIATARLRRATVARQRAQQAYDDIEDAPDAETSGEALDLQVAKLEYELAQAEFDRVLEGSDNLTITRLEVELAQAEQALIQAQRRLEYTRLTAPFAGTVMRLTVAQGENLGAWGIAAVLADLTQLEIRAEIDEIDVAQVSEGQTVEIMLDALPNEVLHGSIAQVLPGVSDTRGTTTYQAVIVLEAWPAAIRPGMGANLTITTQSAEGVLLVPRRAIQQAGRRQYVRILENRQVQPVEVTTGLGNGDEITILGGLVEGQVVLLD